MKIPNLIISIFILISIQTLTQTTAEIKNLNLAADPRPLIFFDRFGFKTNGSVSIAISESTFSSSFSSPDPSLFGFVLLSSSSLLQTLQNPDLNSNCILSSPYIRLLFTLRDLSPPPFNSYNRSFPISIPGDYSLFFASCVPESQVSMQVSISMFNSNPDGSPDYLSVGDGPLPMICFVFGLVYVMFSVIWVRFGGLSHRVHYLMAGLLIAKSLNLLFKAEDLHYVRTTGTPHGWDVLFYLFQFIKGVLLFTVIVLIGTGWSVLKPFLQNKEKKVLMVVIPLQVITNVASIVIGETGPFAQDWAIWVQVFLLVDVICCCAVLFPIVWSIRSLRTSSKSDGKAARNLRKLVAFRRFYIGVIGYLYFTRVVVFALSAVLSYKYKWVSVAVEEEVTLAFYALMFYLFRPKVKNDYFGVDDEGEAAAMVALRDEEFEI